MARFIISLRRTGRSHGDMAEAAATQSLHSVARALQGSVLRAADPWSGRQMVLADDYAGEMARVRASNQDPGVIVEPVVARGHTPIVLGQYLNRGLTTPHVRRITATPAPSSLQVNVASADAHLPGVPVTLVLTPLAVLNKTTGTDGACSFPFDHSSQTPSAVITNPFPGFWTVVTTSLSDPTNLLLPQIEQSGPLAWWHEALGAKAYDASRGHGIRVGVIDTGVGPNVCLSHVKLMGSMIELQFDPDGGADVDVHGTAIAGLIGSRPQNPLDFAGLAAGVELLSIRVFKPNGGANQVDVAASIDRMVEVEKVDLINLSLTGIEPSELELDAIRYAYENGVLCVCAAGNDAGPIQYPAAYPETVSVSALGKKGWGPPQSIAAQMEPTEPDQLGREGLFLAPFSSRGSGLCCCAPGLGIISAFPAKSPALAAWGEDSGTSLSTPLAVAALATILAKSADYINAPRDSKRADLAKRLLANATQTIGISATYEGKGIPVVS
jgi:subtilisin family serine protease